MPKLQLDVKRPCPADRKQVAEEDYGAWITDPTTVQPHIALLDGKPIGYIQSKAGFRAVGEVQTPDGVAWLMVCERPAGAP